MVTRGTDRVEAKLTHRAGPSMRPSHPLLLSRRAVAILAGVLMICLARGRAMQTSDNEAIRRIDAAVHARTGSIAGYTVQELYSIYRNGEATPSAQVTVKTVYTRSAGKEYTPIAQTGSSLLRNIIIDRILANEKEMARAVNRESVAITSANYEMHPEPGAVFFNGRSCILVDIKARRKISYLFNGKAWFDAADFTLVHIEGSPAQSPSFFAGETSGRRDYTKVDGFSMALHAELHSHSFLFGNTILKIDYTDYQIQLESTKPVSNTSSEQPAVSSPAPSPSN
jgi:hypothetical protein